MRHDVSENLDVWTMGSELVRVGRQSGDVTHSDRELEPQASDDVGSGLRKRQTSCLAGTAGDTGESAVSSERRWRAVDAEGLSAVEVPAEG